MILATLAPVYAAAEAVGISRFVYISTGVVHGQAPAPGTNEQTPLSVRQPFAYNTAKVRAERKLRHLRGRSTVELVLLRPTIVFGPGSRWVNDFAQALRRQTACIVDDGAGICNSIYVDNLAHAVRLALRAPGVDGEAFLVGDRETVTWADLYRPIATGLGFDYERVAHVTPREFHLGVRARYIEPFRSSAIGQLLSSRVPPGVKAWIRGAYRAQRRRDSFANPADALPEATVSDEIALLQRCRWRLPNDKARRLLGYSPPVPFAEGCDRSIAWLRAPAL
jgi:nucleoside-diphosphate-sugar epimerase